MTASQARAARAILGLTRRELSDKAGVSENTIISVEKHDFSYDKLAKSDLIKFFHSQGIFFCEGEASEMVIKVSPDNLAAWKMKTV